MVMYSKRHMLVSLMLGLLASSLSIGISAVAGWSRGSTDEQRFLLAAVGVLAVLGAHLLPGLWSQAPLLVRTMGLGLWVACSLFVAYGHTSYYLAAVDQAGTLRVSQLDRDISINAERSKRPLSAILTEKAKLQTALAVISKGQCTESCAALKAKESALRGRILAVEAEADEARRWQRAQDQVETRRTELRTDPAVTQLAETLGVEPGVASALIGLVCSVILEGLGCMCWYLLLRRSDQIAMNEVSQLTLQDGCAATPRASESLSDHPQVPDIPLDVASIQKEIDAGRLACTVESIRKYMACSQRRATELRRHLSSRREFRGTT